MTALAPEVVTTSRGRDDDELDHIYCCDENLAMCGADVTGVPLASDDDVAEDMCVVCDDLAAAPCQRCGATS